MFVLRSSVAAAVARRRGTLAPRGAAAEPGCQRCAP